MCSSVGICKSPSINFIQKLTGMGREGHGISMVPRWKEKKGLSRDLLLIFAGPYAENFVVDLQGLKLFLKCCSTLL